MKINKKPILTNFLVNNCKCGKKLILKRCIWLDETEDILNIFSFQAKRLNKNTLNPKYKMRKFYLAWCSCGRLFFNK